MLPEHHQLASSTAPFATPPVAALTPAALGQSTMTAASPLMASQPTAALKPMSPGSDAAVTGIGGASGSGDVQPVNCTLFVANIGQSCTEQDLRDVFGT